ncbi:MULTISPECIES: HAD family hydrolase [Photorhabdus]|uniref:phosphoglycolate phosphatase n=1 Tax=Photorhabdus thracensis TaxID=230089 RepID=A0A0F7LU29_9GAMM|nr:HAD family hydrolase [Photorhabdus thracensis]AKH65307.1 hydrolase [Photorhabdus thracensis]
MNKILIFDLDGTLFDTSRAIVETFNAVFKVLKIPLAGDENIRATIGLPLEKAFATLLNIFVEEPLISKAVEQYQLQYRRCILPKAKELLFPGVEDGLIALNKKDVKLSVATSKFTASATALLQAAGIDAVFDRVIGADQVSKPKPDPESGRKILEYYSAMPEMAVMVGDTTHDIYMANAVGMRSIAVTYGIHSVCMLEEAKPTWIANCFYNVLHIIEENILK